MFCFVKFIIDAAAFIPPTDEALKDVLVLNFNCITLSSSARASAELFPELQFYVIISD